MKYKWKTTDIWSANHLVSGNTVACFTPNNTVDISLMPILSYTKNKDKCQKCKECKEYKQKDIYMKYEWKTTSIWKYNHLAYDYRIYCFNELISQTFIIRKEDEKKSRCVNCIRYYRGTRRTYDNGPNVLHINRRIFI